MGLNPDGTWDGVGVDPTSGESGPVAEIGATQKYATETEPGILALPDAPVTDPTETIEKIEEAYGAVDPGEVPTDYADVDVAGIETEFKPGEEYVTPSATVS